MEELNYPTVQVITVFVPNFKTGTIKLRQLIVGNDWVETCNNADEKYGVWFCTIEEAQAILNRPILTEM